MIYVIHCDGYCKIGTTRDDPEQRLKTLQTGSPHELHLMVVAPGGADEEKALHERYAHKWVRGEWFELDYEDIRAISALSLVRASLPPLERPQVKPPPIVISDDYLEDEFTLDDEPPIDLS